MKKAFSAVALLLISTTVSTAQPAWVISGEGTEAEYRGLKHGIDGPRRLSIRTKRRAAGDVALAADLF
jgi:hypothetical protein